MPVATEQKVIALCRDLGSPRRLAELLGVDPAEVERWQHGGRIDDTTAERVDILEVVMASLLRLYSVEAARRWLVGTNPSLGDRRPVDVIRGLQFPGAVRVLDAIANERAGTFA